MPPYATGRGRLIVRARTEIEEHGNDRYRIVITEIPYQVNKLTLVKSIIDLVDEKRIEGIHDVVDHSSREGMRVVIDLKRDANPQVVLNQLIRVHPDAGDLWRHYAGAGGRCAAGLSLKRMLEEYIRFQVEVITRRTLYDLRKPRSARISWKRLRWPVTLSMRLSKLSVLPRIFGIQGPFDGPFWF